MNCNFCHKPLEHTFLDLGFQPPSNSFLTKEQLDEPETYYPLRAYVCDKCFLVQVPESKKAAEIFKEDYPYYSSQSPSNISHAKEYVEMITERFNPKHVLEIGSNDGYLLQHFMTIGRSDVGVKGVEPSAGPSSRAWGRGIVTDIAFFGIQYAQDQCTTIPGGVGIFDLICSINTIAHQPDLNDFVEGIRIALKPDGVTTHEFPWLLKTVKSLQFDQFYHEHFSYFSLSTLAQIFNKHGLCIFDVDELSGHGGSLRIYARHVEQGGDHGAWEKVDAIMERERYQGMMTLDYYQGFQPKAEKVRSVFMRFLYEKPKICAYGAPAKANTFLNYCKVTSDLLPFTIDISPYKQGKFLPGSHVPILTEEDLINYRPDYVLVLVWNLKEEIMKQLEYIRNWNGKFVVAIPSLEIF